MLEALRAHFEVALVVAQPDKPVGRGLRLTPPPVAARALELSLPLAQPVKLRGNADFAARLAASGAEVAVTCAYGKILPASLLAVPPRGFLNTHTSLLPHYRGAAPIQWALIRGETVTGTTIMQTDPGLDTGPILQQEALPIAPEWTSVELSAALAAQAARLIVDVLERLDDFTPQPQDDAQASHAPLLDKEDGRVRWTEAAGAVLDRYRGVYSWPGSFTTWRGRLLKITAMRLGAGQGEPGEILAAADGLRVACGTGAVDLLTVQPEGKRPMPAADWWRGAGGQLGERLGVV